MVSEREHESYCVGYARSSKAYGIFFQMNNRQTFDAFEGPDGENKAL